MIALSQDVHNMQIHNFHCILLATAKDPVILYTLGSLLRNISSHEL